MSKELTELLEMSGLKEKNNKVPQTEPIINLNQLHISEIRLTFDTLEKAMGLPSDAKVVAVQEEDIKGVLKFRIVSLREPPEEYTFDALSMAGEAYTNPEKYKSKGHKGEFRSSVK